MALASGGDPGTGEEDQRSGGPVVDLQPNLTTIQVCRKYEGHLYGHKINQCILYYDQSDPQVARRVRSRRQDERNSTSLQRRRETSSNLVRVFKVMRVGHRQGGGVKGVRQASFAKPPRRFGAFDESGHTQPPVEYPSGKPLEAKLLKEQSYHYPTTE